MPPMKQNAVVPFGKYKGQPMEQLAADPEYCEWLSGQSWFIEKYAHIHTLIINNFGDPSETPEHNRLQLRFLDETFRRQCMQAAGIAKHLYAAQPMPAFEVGGLDVHWTSIYWQISAEHHSTGIYEGHSHFYEEHKALDSKANHEQWEYARQKEFINSWPKRVQDLQSKIQGAQYVHLRDEPTRALKEGSETYIKFMQSAKTLEQSVYTSRVLADAYKEEYEIVFRYDTRTIRYEWMKFQGTSIGIECKPALGDDYPAVLRFMRNIRQRPEIYCLVIGALRSQAATMDQLRLVFAQAKIVLLSVDEIEATTPPPAWEKHELPNPLEDQSFIDSNN